MNMEALTLESVATVVGCDVPPDELARRLLQRITILFDGYGSIARPASEELARLGAGRFVLTDPKHYVAESVYSQCEDTEVGRRKVEVGAQRLCEAGAHVTSIARDIASVPEGVIALDAIVITTVDNRRADILSNRRAARMGARLIKVNVEPALGVAAVRAYDFRGASPLCVECQFGNHHYAAQRHPRSCDGAVEGPGERRTNSPRGLSQLAAYLAVLATLDLAGDREAADAWLGRERQYFLPAGDITSSQLKPNPNCRWEHAHRWRNIVRLGQTESEISLRELFWAASIEVDARAKIRVCQQVVLRGRCAKCRADFPVVRWIADSRAPLGVCASCVSPLWPIPFSIFSETSVEPLLGVLDQPLNEWGVERAAVIEISRNDRRVSFVVGSH
jgi:hypothetical protein